MSTTTTPGANGERRARPYVVAAKEVLTAEQIAGWGKTFGRTIWWWTKAQCEQATANPDGYAGPYEAAKAAAVETARVDEKAPVDISDLGDDAIDAAEALTRTIAAIAGKFCSPEKVREIVSETFAGKIAEIDRKVDERIKELKPDRFEVALGELPKVEIEGRPHKAFETVLKYAMARRPDGQRFNILLVGPAGCGKSVLACQIAKAMSTRYANISLSEGVSESSLIGRFVPTGENGRFEYVWSQFARYYADGGVFCLEEIDSADANVLLAINNALSNGHMATPNPDAPMLERHKDFVCIACANTWGNGADRVYVGRNQLDQSTVDRFRATRVAVDYDTAMECEIGHKELADWAQRVRAKCSELGLRRVVSTRWIADASSLVAQGVYDVATAKAGLLMDWTKDELSKIGALADGLWL